MQDNTLKNGARAGRYTTPDTLYTEYLSTLKAEPTVRTSSSIASRIQHVPKQKNNPHYEARCYNCRKIGHRANSCPNPRIECKKCKRLGHVEEDCRRNFKTTTKSQAAMTIEDQSTSENDVYLIDCLVNGVSTKAYVDSGATPVLLTKELAEVVAISWSCHYSPLRRWLQDMVVR